MINDAMKQCRYCSVQVDQGVAALLAERQEKVNQAYSDASYLRTAAIAMFVFLGVGMTLTFAYWGFVGSFGVVAVMLIRWQLKFNELLTNDTDYLRARQFKNLAFVLLIVAFPLGLLFCPLWGLILPD